MNHLFIDTLSSPAYICLFDNEKNIIDSISWEGKHAEFDTLVEYIDVLIIRNKIEYSQIHGMYCIVGPGGFTGIRVTTLIANTIAYSFSIPLYAITISDFFQAQNAPLPWILPLTKTEVLLWEKPNPLPSNIANKSELGFLTQYSSNHLNGILDESIQNIQAHNYALFLKNCIMPSETALLQPLYARDPNILVRK